MTEGYYYEPVGPADLPTNIARRCPDEGSFIGPFESGFTDAGLAGDEIDRS